MSDHDRVTTGTRSGREGDIPFYRRWPDESEYRCVRISEPDREHGFDRGLCERSYHGPRFGRALFDWHRETFAA